ncbi:synaptonemal complex protein 3, partial [Patella vulgata]|uniref:synaptonemal complex protein 3 n=1 Tax=Patella vulgata TaxID=6465 RepID=UPI00217FAE09
DLPRQNSGQKSCKCQPGLSLSLTLLISDGETPIVARGGGKKRPLPDEEGHSGDFGSEMQKMLECFGADISKTLISKRKRLEQLTHNTLRSSNKKVEDIWKAQQTERVKLQEEYYKQIGTVFSQWEVDIDKTRDQEEKLTVLFKQQQKLFQQARIVQGQRLKTIRQLQEQFSKGMDELDKCHLTQQSSVQSELKKEMGLLQKKILMDTQQQEMANVRKSLQTMLF